jgi:hypothetical protein
LRGAAWARGSRHVTHDIAVLVNSAEVEGRGIVQMG